MENIRKKALFPYIVIELLLFVVSYVFAVSPIKNSFDYRIITAIGLAINIAFIALTLTRNKMDFLFGIVFTSIFLLSFIFGNLLEFKIVGMILAFISFSSLIVRMVLDDGKRNIIKFIPVMISFVLSVVLSIIKPFGYEFISLISTAILLFEVIVLSILKYKNGPTLEKPNWFFLASGAVIYLVYNLSYCFGPSMDDTALLKGMISFASVILIIPSIVLITITFTIFQPREA